MIFVTHNLHQNIVWQDISQQFMKERKCFNSSWRTFITGLTPQSYYLWLQIFYEAHYISSLGQEAIFMIKLQLQFFTKGELDTTAYYISSWRDQTIFDYNYSWKEILTKHTAWLHEVKKPLKCSNCSVKQSLTHN